MSFAGILSLPFELFDEIIDYVAMSAQEMFTLRCVNKTLCSLVTPAAFREIVVHTTEKSSQGFLELLVSADIAKHVRVVRIIEDPVPYSVETERDEDERFKRVGNRLRGACFMLHLIPALESLVIEFFTDGDAWMQPFSYADDLTRYHRLQWEVLDGLARNPSPLPALRSLQIDNWFAYPNELYYAAPFERMLASLRDLRFTVQDTDYKSDLDHFPAEDFWGDFIGPRVLEPAVNLESLAMSCDLDYGSLFRLNLGWVTYPCLTSLSLSNFVWDDARVNPRAVVPEAEDFIVRHGQTLKKLELHHCTICVPGDKLTPVRSWAAVWNRFAEELIELVDLVVAYNPHRQYVYFLQDYGFNSDATCLLRGTDQDAPALQAFGTVVKDRKKLTSRVGD